MLKVNIMLYMNHMIHHIETPPGLTPPSTSSSTSMVSEMIILERPILRTQEHKNDGGGGVSEYPILGQSQYPFSILKYPCLC